MLPTQPAFWGICEPLIFFAFIQKFKMGIKNGRKTIFGESGHKTADTLRVKKFRQNRSMSHRFRAKCAFTFYAKNGRENDFLGKSIAGCRYPAGQKIRQNHSISHSY